MTEKKLPEWNPKLVNFGFLSPSIHPNNFLAAVQVSIRVWGMNWITHFKVIDKQKLVYSDAIKSD